MNITIVGAGIFGLSCAWEIARRGGAVHVVEARHIGAGSSGGTVGALAPHAPDGWNAKKAFQLQSLLAAPDFWAGVEAASGLSSGYGRTGRLQPVPDAATVDRLQARIEASRAYWPSDCAMHLTADPQSTLIAPSPIGLWLRDGLSARLCPRQALRALAAAIRSAGGQITEGQTVRPGDLDGPVLWATGTEGLLDLTADLGRSIGQGVKGQSLLLRFSAPESPQLFVDGLHIVPHQNGTVAVGSTSENTYDHDRPDTLSEALLARARALCPVLKEAELLETWAGLRPRARSRAPLVGEWPGRSGHYVVNGGFKIGFGMAPSLARIMADLILTGRDQIPDAFRLR